MIIAKNDPVQSALNDMFARRQVKKTYLAITCGIPDPAEDIIESNIGRSLSNPRKMCVTPEGRWSLTRYKVIKYFHCFSLVKVALETGRMHQIRCISRNATCPCWATCSTIRAGRCIPSFRKTSSAR